MIAGKEFSPEQVAQELDAIAIRFRLKLPFIKNPRNVEILNHEIKYLIEGARLVGKYAELEAEAEIYHDALWACRDFIASEYGLSANEAAHDGHPISKPARGLWDYIHNAMAPAWARDAKFTAEHLAEAKKALALLVDAVDAFNDGYTDRIDKGDIQMAREVLGRVPRETE